MLPYEITVDEKRRILRATLSGFWDVIITTRYLADLHAAGSQVSRGGERNWWIIDTIGYAVQAQEVTELMKEKLSSIFKPEATVAILIGSTLQSMQVKRAAPDQHHRCFSTIREAEHWLADSGMPT